MRKRPGRPKLPAEQRVVDLHISLSQQHYHTLEEAAEKMDRPISWVVRAALDLYFQDRLLK